MGTRTPLRMKEEHSFEKLGSNNPSTASYHRRLEPLTQTMSLMTAVPHNVLPTDIT
jgi:hypothetical protein